MAENLHARSNFGITIRFLDGALIHDPHAAISYMLLVETRPGSFAIGIKQALWRKTFLLNEGKK